MEQAEELYSILVKTCILLDDSDRLLFRQHKLSSIQYYALVHLHQSPGLSQNELSECLLCTKGNVTRVVKSLEGNGYITREVDREDNRVLRLYLTLAGKNLMLRTRKSHRKLNALRFLHLGDMERDSLQQSLNALKAHLEALVRQQRS